MKSLKPEDFDEYFREVNEGREPFPWQFRLAGEVITGLPWPDVLALPTAVAKQRALTLRVRVGLSGRTTAW